MCVCVYVCVEGNRFNIKHFPMCTHVDHVDGEEEGKGEEREERRELDGTCVQKNGRTRDECWAEGSTFRRFTWREGTSACVR